MTNRNLGEPWPGMTYGGFSGSTPASRHESGPDVVPSRSRLSKRGVIGGVAAALLAGVLFGVFAQPDLGGNERAMVRESPAGESAARPVPIDIAPVPPEPAPVARERMEVLPSDVRAGSGAAIIPPPPPALPPLRRAEAPPASQMRPPLMQQQPQVQQQAQASSSPPPVQQQAAAEPAPRLAAASPSFNCRYARSRSEQMVCADPALARLDRRLNAAFRMAVNSGVPYRDLRADQDEWLNIREDAAAYSRGAVANIYRQRISELEAMAEGQ